MKAGRKFEGFTLIELMVVVLIVAILGLALAPMIGKMITRSKYTEADAAIAAIRNDSRIFYLENSRLPGVAPAQLEYLRNITTNIVGSSKWDSSGLTYGLLLGGYITAQDVNCSQRFTSSSSNSFTVTDGTGGTSTNVGTGPIQGDLKIAGHEIGGKYFKAKHYQMRVDHAGMNDNSYMYTVAALGDGSEGSPKSGTGYAVMEVVCPGFGNDSKVTMFWERYEPESNMANSAQPLWLECITTSDGMSQGAKVNGVTNCPNFVPVPTFQVLQNCVSNTWGSPVNYLKYLGWQ